MAAAAVLTMSGAESSLSEKMHTMTGQQRQHSDDTSFSSWSHAAAAPEPISSSGETGAAAPTTQLRFHSSRSPSSSPRNGHEFDPKKHLNYVAPARIYTMQDIGLPVDRGVSPVAVSEPFQLFSHEAVMRMRDEVLSDEVRRNCSYSTNMAKCQLRGYADRYAPFVYDVWRSPEVLSIMSQIAGIDLVPALDFDIGHINISATKSEEERQAEVAAYYSRQSTTAKSGHHDEQGREENVVSPGAQQQEEDEGISGCHWNEEMDEEQVGRIVQHSKSKTSDDDDDDKPIVDWHYDSYPFVCVTMLSDCTSMIGGETALRTGTGEIKKVRGPQMGCAVILQGRYIQHQALRALGTRERITMVTSFRPRDPFVRDDTVLTTVRPISDLPTLYNQFATYRLEMLEERVRAMLRELREASGGGAVGRKVSTKRLKEFFAEQKGFLENMDREVVRDEDVKVGVQIVVGEADQP